MTFALVAANADQVIQISDRRLTSWNGTVLVEDSGKAGYLMCDDATALYCYTGLAKLRSFKTSTWLMESLMSASRRDSSFRELIEHFAELATEHFSSNEDILSAPINQRRLTVMLSGYTASGHITNALISNFQDFISFVDHPEAQPKFTVYCESSKSPATLNPTYIQAIGTFGALTLADEDELRKMLEDRAPHQAITNKAVAIVTSISDRHRSGGAVGKRLNTGRIDYTSPFVPFAGYASDVVEGTLPLLDMVDGRTNGTGLLVGQPKLTAESSFVFPKVHRNAMCPCGSGKKYRFCHRLVQR
jgi:hypothetical protein